MTENIVKMQITEDVIDFTLTEKTVVILPAMFGFNEEDTYGYDSDSYGFYDEEVRL